MNYLIRAVIACIGVIVFYIVLTPIMHILGFSINADLMLIIKVAVAICALAYIAWGRPVVIQ